MISFYEMAWRFSFDTGQNVAGPGLRHKKFISKAASPFVINNNLLLNVIMQVELFNYVQL